MINKKMRKKTKKELSVVIDSCWLIAYLNSEDIHHVPVVSSYGLMRPYNPVFYVPTFVYMEALSILRRQKIPFNKCYKRLEKFFSDNTTKHETGIIGKKVILEKYRRYSRSKISFLKGMDFYIATEGVTLNALILTCDKEMYKKVRKYYNKIYFTSNQVSDVPSDSSKLLTYVEALK